MWKLTRKLFKKSEEVKTKGSNIPTMIAGWGGDREAHMKALTHLCY